MHTQKNSNNLRSHLRDIMALDHSRLGPENKFLENNSGRIFCVRQVYLPTNLGACKPTFYTFYIQYFEALFLSYRPRTECSISEFYNTNFILASNLTADNFKKILNLDGSAPEPPIRSGDTGQRIPCSDSCQLITTLMWNMCAISFFMCSQTS